MQNLTPECATQVLTSPQAAVYSTAHRGNTASSYNYAFTNDSNQTVAITFQGCAKADFGARIMDLVNSAGVVITLTLLAGEKGYAILSDPWNWVRAKVTPVAPAAGNVTLDITEK